MSYTHYQSARTFRRLMEQPTETKDCRVHELQLDLITEEFGEFSIAHHEGRDIETVKELADLAYVCYQYAAARGWDLDEALERVHRSNLSKLDDDLRPIKREDGKVLKGPNYKKPFLQDLI